MPIGPGEAATTVPDEDEAASVNLTFNREGQVIGIEVLRASAHLSPEVIERAELIG